MNPKDRIFQSLRQDIQRHKAFSNDRDALTRLYHLGAVDALEALERDLPFWMEQMESDAVIRGMDRADVIWKRETARG